MCDTGSNLHVKNGNVRIYSITRSMLVVDCRDAPRFNLVGFSGSNIRDGVFSIEAITRIGATYNQYSL